MGEAFTAWRDRKYDVIIVSDSFEKCTNIQIASMVRCESGSMNKDTDVLVYTNNEDVVYHLEEVQHIIGLNKDKIDTFMLCDSIFESFGE